MEVTQQRLEIADDSQIGAARRTAALLAARCSLSETEAGRLALIVNELGTNLRKHAGRGELFLRGLLQQGACGVEVLSIDAGPGMPLEESMRDGHSTAGSRGEGLGAVQRASDEFDAWSAPGKGSVLVARVWAGGPVQLPLVIGAVALPYPGETESGDGWVALASPARTSLLLVDGLGHGPSAALAALTAVQAFEKLRDPASAESAVQALHAALRPTRGAALMALQIDLVARTLRSCGVGNISASLLERTGPSRGLISHNGIAGHEARRMQEFTLPLPPRFTLVAHSDGLSAQWRMDAYPGLLHRHPSVIAGVLSRDFRRKTDDSTVLAVQEP